MKSHGVRIIGKSSEDPFQSIENAQNSFTEVYQQVFKIKADIIPLHAVESQHIKRDLDAFLRLVDAFRSEFLKNMPFEYTEAMGMDDMNSAYDIIMAYFVKLSEIKRKAEEFDELERLFEL